MVDGLLIALLSGGAVYALFFLSIKRSRQEKAELAKNERRFRELTELSADWFWETDAEHRLVWLSGGTPVATFLGHTPVYGEAPPTSTGAPVASAGNRTQSKVSWTQRTRRNARLPKNDAITPGLVSTPALGPPLTHSASVNTEVPSLKVGQLLAGFVNRSM